VVRPFGLKAWVWDPVAIERRASTSTPARIQSWALIILSVVDGELRE